VKSYPDGTREIFEQNIGPRMVGGHVLWTGDVVAPSADNLSGSRDTEQPTVRGIGSARRIAIWYYTGQRVHRSLRVSVNCGESLCVANAHLVVQTMAAVRRQHPRKIVPQYLTPSIVLKIRDAVLRGMSHVAAATQYGTTPQNVNHILAGRTWAQVTGIR
jgi:hypothetical protein